MKKAHEKWKQVKDNPDLKRKYEDEATSAQARNEEFLASDGGKEYTMNMLMQKYDRVVSIKLPHFNRKITKKSCFGPK